MKCTEKELLLGLDLTCSDKKPTAYALLDGDLRITGWGSAVSDADILRLIEKERPRVVAIDAPLTLPLGWHCLGPGCDCNRDTTSKGRACERELSRQGIPSYYTGTKCFIKPMIYRAIDLKREIKSRGLNVIEVYPYASKVRLWGRPIPKKARPQGIAFLRSKLSELIPDPNITETKRSHDLYDAPIAAYTVYLHNLKRTEPIGEKDEGLIWLPRF